MNKKIGLLTSGGDAPGMNAAIRSIVRMGVYQGHEMVGIEGGWQGIFDKKFLPMDFRSVSNIIQKGGTILRSSRSEEFKTTEGVKRGAKILDKEGINALIAIGGDGTFRGCLDLDSIWDGQVIGVPGTIDNDVYGTEDTIGFDTATNTALFAIDKIRDTADAHERFFVIEVMGRKSGFIALSVAIASGAEEVIIPETKTDLAQLASELSLGRDKGKRSSLVIVAEGSNQGNAYEIAKKLEEYSGTPYRIVVLGHLLRGGSPSAYDRLLASELGSNSIEAIDQELTGIMCGKRGGKCIHTSLQEAVTLKKTLSSNLQKLQPILAL
ncbi:6-phosphofructokinase [Chlamydiales bacterium]|nr:6-phosphofructokinase [Chlamydiales bacterium]